MLNRVKYLFLVSNPMLVTVTICEVTDDTTRRQFVRHDITGQWRHSHDKAISSCDRNAFPLTFILSKGYDDVIVCTTNVRVGVCRAPM